MSYPDLYPSGPAQPPREVILDQIAGIITDYILETLDCAACDEQYPCPAHHADAQVAEDCRAAYLHLAAGANR